MRTSPPKPSKLKKSTKRRAKKRPPLLLLSQAEIENELREHGSGVQDGKWRIIELYVGETDVRIDTSAHGQSWDNEVLNKRQFEDGLRRDEPTPDEELNKLPISTEVNGEWQTFPNAAAANEALNAEPMPEAAGNFHITDDNLGVGGPKQKFARNIEAIQTLRTLEQEHRGATAEEQQVLSQYPERFAY